jgi:hypothetical protein
MSLDSPIFQVIIGIVFVYVLLSILVTQINAVISSFRMIRANHLRDGINDLIQDPILRAKVMSHPLVRLVDSKLVLPDQQLSDSDAEQIIKSKLRNIGYIDPKTFVNVLMNVIRVSTDKDLFGVLLNVVDGMPANADRRRLRLVINQLTTTGEGIQELREVISSLQEPIYREALSEALDEIDDLIGQMGLEPNSVISLMAGLRNIKNPYFRQVMETVLSTSRTLDEAESQLISWFNDGMGRVSDSFSRYMGLLSLGIGLILAVVLNADTIQIARALWSDPALRFTVAAAAQQYNATNNPTVVVQTSRLQPTPVPTPLAEGEVAEEQTSEVLTQLATDVAAAQSTADQIVSLNLPIGWQWEVLTPYDVTDTTNESLYSNSNNIWNYIPGNSPHFLGLWLSKIVGLLITMVAVAQGAPFWFNVLNRLARGQGVSLGK